MDKLEVIVKALDEKLGSDIAVIDMREISAIYDTFVLCSANNEPMMNALVDNVEQKAAEQGYFVKSKEGKKNSKWILMDFGDIVVHIFDKDERELYNIEKLWADMPRLSVEEMLD